jgi:hypothetical protein
VWQVRVFGAVIVYFLGKVGHGPVASVATEPDGFAASGDSPRGPERGVAVEGSASRGVLTGEAGNTCCDQAARGRSWGWGGVGIVG